MDMRFDRGTSQTTLFSSRVSYGAGIPFIVIIVLLLTGLHTWVVLFVLVLVAQELFATDIFDLVNGSFIKVSMELSVTVRGSRSSF